MERAPAERLRFGGEAATLIVCEAKAARPEVFTQDAVFLHEVVDRMLLVLIHPAGYRNKQEAERIQT